MPRPQNVGIKAIEIYFPNRYVPQPDLEKYMHASAGKHTIGLGQTNMSFCDDREAELLAPQNPDIEGVDSYNACYGGTAALLAAVAWIESSAWGTGAPRASYMRHAWDFFKADFGREAAFVDGRLSERCYLEAVDGCYRGWGRKMMALGEGPAAAGVGVGAGIDAFDYFLFHAPNCKLVAKAYARLLWNDLLRGGEIPEGLRPASLDDECTLGNKGLEKRLMALARSRFEERVRPALLVPSQCGNMYSASLYSGLVGLLASVPSERLRGKRIGLFSYGSGLASTLFTLVVRGDTSVMAQKLDLHRRLAARVPAAPEVWDEMCRLREGAFQWREYVPRGDVGDLLPGTYYLEYVDEKLRRRYAVKA